jgi:hypothetical protein
MPKIGQTISTHNVASEAFHANLGKKSIWQLLLSRLIYTYVAR